MMKKMVILVVLLLSCPTARSGPRKAWAGMDLAELPSSRPTPAARPRAKPRRAPPCLKREPRPADLIVEALREAGLERQAGEDMRSKARLAGFLPKLDGGLSMDAGDRWYARYEPGEPMVEQQQQDDGLNWDVGLSWDLSRMAYHDDDLAVAKERVKRAQQRRELAAEVIRLYFARKRLLLAGRPAPGSLAAQQVDEFTALLDAWTAGRFAHRWCKKEKS